MLRWTLFSVPLVLGLGFLSGVAAGSGPSNPWFAALVKPGIYPPPEVFPIVWSALYLLMGIALALVLSARGASGRGLAAGVFALHLLVNLAWSPVFFALHQMTLALYIIAAMIVLALLTVVLFWRVRRVAAVLLLPYLAWICFASALNYEFLRLNPEADGASGAAKAVRVAI